MSSSNGEYRKVTQIEIHQVKKVIETCILNYFPKKDVIDVLYQNYNVEPCFTKIVWRNLEEQNKEFFRHYYLRLALKEQITRFNEALEIQVNMVKRLNADKVVANLPPSGFNNCTALGLQHGSSYPCNTFLAQNPNVELVEQGMDIGRIRISNECGGDLGNIPAPVSSSAMGLNSHKLERTFTDDLLEYIASQPVGLFGSDDITVENQGAGNMSSSFDFQNCNNFSSQDRCNGGC